MDAMKKEIVYNLGLVYQRMGEREKSLACMKQIYELEHGYRDVATRVESSYQKNISKGRLIRSSELAHLERTGAGTKRIRIHRVQATVSFRFL